MDTFEPIRAEAIRLHEAVIAAGADSLSPTSMVAAALKHYELELVYLPAKDPALKGSRALFDEQTGTVCCEDSGSEAERVLLVAHEIGHVAMHAGTSLCTPTDIDPSASPEAAPVGLQRVEDYGARERRELQANVFAREFLFPRSIAAHLHLQQNMSAAGIAQKTGLPIPLVRQQLYDALLLPRAPMTSAGEPVESAYMPRPDPSQDLAAAHRGAPFLLQAGPGTGKTRTLIKRVSSLLAESVDPASILVLTFSNRAAGELAERLSLNEPDVASRIWIGTFHAFGLDLIRRYHDRLDLPPDPPLFDRSDAIEVLEEVLPTLPLVHYRNLWDPALILREIVGAISRAKDELVDPTQYRALAQSMFDVASNAEEVKAAEKCLEVAEIYDIYTHAIRDRGAVDFGDLIMRPALLLESDEAVRVTAQYRHRHVLVDEYQDVNRASARLLKVVAGDGKRLWVVGDARQSIYRFRGASSTNMVRFAQDYPGAKTAQLDLNYRSTEQVVRSFVAVAAKMGASQGMLHLQLKADRGEGPVKPQIRRYETLDEEAAGVAASVRELEAGGIPLRNQAVLCRTNLRLNAIAAALEVRDVPVLHLGSLFERDEVRDLLALLSLAVDRFGDSLFRVAAMPRYNASLQDVYAATRHLHSAGQAPLLGISTLSAVEGISEQGRAAFERLASDVAGFKPGVSAWDFLSTVLLDRTDFVRELAAAVSVTEKMRAVAIWQFLNFVREQSHVSHSLPIQRTLDRVRQLVLLAEERDLRQVPAAALHLDAVRLMTVHGSKGLEFEAVHIPGLTTQSFPSQNKGSQCPPPVGLIEGDENLSVKELAKLAHEQEEECLFFVALSRACTYLRGYLAKKQPNGNSRSASSFLDWLSGGVVEECLAPKIMPLPPGARRPQPIVVTRASEWHVTDTRLIAYERCPRRYLYTHVLRLGGAQKSTAFTKTHDCIYDLIRWLATARKSGAPTFEEADAEFEQIWQTRGPIEHAFRDDYRRLSSRLVGALIRAGAGRRFMEAEPLAIDLSNGRVIVEPNEIAQLEDGTVVVRRVRTGYQRSDEYDRLDYTLYTLAARARFGKAVLVQALHLTDESKEPVILTDRKISFRKDKSEKMLEGISAGWFPPETDAVTCPRCPHFFVCDAVPLGTLAVP
jgi:DNA helicase-2/ATP-dependent DNA helicase PcrA